MIWVVGGVGVWLVGRQQHQPHRRFRAVFGFLVYVVVRGVVNRKFWEIALGVVVLFIYGGVLWGCRRGQPGISWQGHLSVRSAA